MSSSRGNISGLANDILTGFKQTLAFFQSMGIIQSYAFNHSDIFYSSSDEKYLDEFISLLEEIKGALNKLQHSYKQRKPAEKEVTVQASSAEPLYIQASEQLFVVSDQLITPHDELNRLIPTTPAGLEYIVPEVITEPATQSSWVPPDDKDGAEDPDKDNVDQQPLSPEKDRFQCNVCDKVLSSKSSFTFHQEKHAGQKSYCCEHCGKLFTTRANLAAHLTRQHNLNTESAYSCKDCGKLFVRKSALDTHAKVHLVVKPWQCSFCVKTFTQKISRDVHLLTHTGDYKFRCDLCDKKFPTKAKLNYHSKSHGDQFMCNLCDKIFAMRQYLTAHYRTHDMRPSCRLDTVSPQVQPDEAVFKCAQCDRGFPTKQLLSVHTQKHDVLSSRYRSLEKRKMAPRQKHTCEVCGKEFLLKSSLVHHHRQKHATDLTERQKRPFSCHLCHKTFTLQKKARLHMLIHTEQPQHGCSLCGKLFRRKDTLQRHLRWHTSDGLECRVCHVTSANHAAHREHAKTHEAHFKCTRCEKAFRSKTALSFHSQSHDGKFKYQCNMCGKQFVRKCHYRGHLLSHSTDRPYKCDSCNKGFKDQKTCREHTKRVHSHPASGDQMSTNQVAAEVELSANEMVAAEVELSANEMEAGQLAIHSLLAGDDATYGQTYDQFQACVQLQ